MTLTFKIDQPTKFLEKELNDFLQLLIKQDQVTNPNIENITSSAFICLLYSADKAIGIGAIKQVYDTPFDKAGVPTHKIGYNYELGYLYIDNVSDTRGLGLGKTISKLLLKQVEGKNVFATTEISETNPMKFILEKLGFKKLGDTYIGSKTKKTLGLFVKEENKRLEFMFDSLLFQTVKGKLSHNDIENGKRYDEFKQVKGWELKYGYKFNIYSNDHLIDGKKHFHFDNKAENIFCKFDFDGNILESNGKNPIPSNILKDLQYFIKKPSTSNLLNEMWDHLNPNPK